MIFTINALDEEFGASTGSNVNSGAGRSTLDYPPSATSNLTIASNEGDQTPFIFSVGDTYDLDWTGMGGGGTLDDAVVLRSDPDSVEGYTVVFEGVDEDGETVQVIWTPEFDLEQWYFDNFSGGVSPGFYNTDQNAAEEYQYVCFAAGTLISVPDGDACVETLKPGDMVLTLDHGPQRLVWVGQRTVGATCAMAPIEFAKGAIGNDRMMRLSPQHRLLAEHAQSELMFGHAEVLIPALAFVGQPGVRRVPLEAVTYVHLLFEAHEIVVAEGIACESLLLGEMAVDYLRPPEDDATAEAGALFPEIIDMVKFHGMKSARPVLKVYEAAALFNRPPPRRLASRGAML